MDSDQLTPEVRDWLAQNGWSPGRDIGKRADELIQARVKVADRCGVPLVPVPAAVRVIHTYGGLTLRHPKGEEAAWVMDGTFAYDGIVSDIRELAFGLGVELFPVGIESTEHSSILVDEKGRFFYLHHTGGYYAGENDDDAFSRFLRGVNDPDAEDFFV
ncbi:SUKH-3 domain-containing protein [Streptomyces cucumeris]|uniref:SUKH-3 domain-containing protein n=1 Tax=Streptomyces cucumeris TaxID=2962890 RepID=UPI003D736D52